MQQLDKRTAHVTVCQGGMGRLRRLFGCLLIAIVASGYRTTSFPGRRRSSATTPATATAVQRADGELAWFRKLRKTVATVALLPFLFTSPLRADDELARYAAEGNSVGVDGQCFLKKCAIETSQCASDLSCLKGLRCLARCKGGSMCSTGCFAKFGSGHLDGLLQCSVEKNDCVHVPGKENAGWSNDKLADLPAPPLAPYDASSLKGTWYKVMGLDSRYDCFDCQKNSFKVKGRGRNVQSLDMEALFRIPRPNYPGYLQSKIEEELQVTTWNSLSTMRSQGEMFGLTFWENWYVLGDSTQPAFQGKFVAQTGRGTSTPGGRMTDFGVAAASAFTGTASQKGVIPDMKLIFYTGHTLQGSYKGAFLYSRSPMLSPDAMEAGRLLIVEAGLNPNDFCIIKNQCFLKETGKDAGMSSSEGSGGGSSRAAPPLTAAARDRPAERAKDGGAEGATGKAAATASAMAADGGVEGLPNAPFWFLGQNFFRLTNNVASELADWFEDPEILSDWLVSQQEKVPTPSCGLGLVFPPCHCRSPLLSPPMFFCAFDHPTDRWCCRRYETKRVLPPP